MACHSVELNGWIDGIPTAADIRASEHGLAVPAVRQWNVFGQSKPLESSNRQWMPVLHRIRKNRKEIGIPGLAVILTPAEQTRYQLASSRNRALVATRKAGWVFDPVTSNSASAGTSQGEPLQRNSVLKCPGLVAVVTAAAVIKPEHFC